MSQKKGNGDNNVRLSCKLNLEDPEHPSLAIQLTNGQEETIHLFDSPRLPYFIQQEDGSLLVLFGVNPPDPEIDYPMIEIPLTRPLSPGESAGWLVTLSGFHWKDHYQAAREPATLEGIVPVIARVAWGTTAIEPQDRFRTNINTLLKWQNLEECAAGEVIYS